MNDALHDPSLRPDEDFARKLDAQDPLAPYRREFYIPTGPDGQPLIYLCGNSLGLQPVRTRAFVDQELRDWAELAVEGHFRARRPWYPYHERLREPGARLVGALPHEVVFMNGLTVKLHLLRVSFYRPTPQRYRIVIEDAAFPSDIYLARTQLQCRGISPDDGLIVLRPRAGEHLIRTEDVLDLIRREGPSIAVLLLPGVNYYTGQVFDMQRITEAGHAAGCAVGFDLAHAAGNVELRLHDWQVDFAAWCTYKYLNSGPGAVAGCFIHERHARNTDLAALPRFGGWWGNDPATRFRMHLEPEFVPVPTADAWQLSNPPILAMAPVLASLELFDEVGMAAIRAKSLRLTGYLQYLLDQIPASRYTVVTPREPERRGCQFSILAHERPRELHQSLESAGVVCDFREPNVVRVAPAPLYNTYHEVWRFGQILARHA
jgi:kynureninase